jgi:hypothetical protein
MKLLLALFASIFVRQTSAIAQQQVNCGSEVLELREKSEDGSILKFEFGSVREVAKADRAVSRLWVRLERMHVCDTGLRKENSNSFVSAI